MKLVVLVLLFTCIFSGKADSRPLNNNSKPQQQSAFPALQDTSFDNGSQITLATFNNSSIEDLALLGRVWGFLKYHHPKVGSGDINWDYELFRFLPEYTKTTTAIQRDNLLLTWINKLGDVAACSSCVATRQDAKLKPNLTWLQDYQLSEALADKITFIYNNRIQGKHFYLDATRSGSPIFENEASYSSMKLPDAGYRLLTIFRYWNMIEYYFPYKQLTAKPWNNVLTEYISRFIHAQNKWDFEQALLGVIGEVQDTHAGLWSSREKFAEMLGLNFPPVVTHFVENKLVVTDFYTESKEENPKMSAAVGLNIGDVITHINGKAVEEMVKQRLAFYPASNMAAKLRNLAPDLLRSNEKTIEITFVRGSKPSNKTLTLYHPKDIHYFFFSGRAESTAPSHQLLENNIGYITLQTIKKDDPAKIMQKFAKTKGIIIDIRNYPANFVPYSLGTYFVKEKTPFVKLTAPNYQNPGEFNMKPPLDIPAIENRYQGKVVVLVNEKTQSQAEFTTMALQAGENTQVLGSTTAGADGNVSSIPLPGGVFTSISGLGVYYPDGSETQQVGVSIDVEVKPTIAGIRAGRDELLEAAIELIKSE